MIQGIYEKQEMIAVKLSIIGSIDPHVRAILMNAHVIA